MSGHLRFEFAAFVLVAGFATPAASNPFTDLFSPNTAPEAAAEAPAPAQEECLLQPGKSAAAGQHWVYRHDGHRKCWFQAELGTALARKPVHRHAASQRAAVPEENESAPRKDESIEDAHAEMLSSTQAQAPQPTPPALKIVQAAPVPVTGGAALVPPVLATPGTDQVTPDQLTRRSVDVETLLADAPAASDEVASDPPAMPVAVPRAETDGGGGWTPWLGVLLMVLGLAALLSGSRTLRSALWPARFLAPEQSSRSSRLTADTVPRSVGVRRIGQQRAR
jgi:hypothetical protein